MSREHEQSATPVTSCQGLPPDARVLAFLGLFNRQLYYEAHEVLEPLWLAHRNGAEGNFLKGLIQLAAALLHARKGRSQPALSLFRLARANLGQYPEIYCRLRVGRVIVAVDEWLQTRAGDATFAAKAERGLPKDRRTFPRLELVPASP